LVRVLGMDPGSKSIDLCGLCDGEVCFERSIDTIEASRDPARVVDAIEEFGGADLIALPSGYGVEVTYLDSIRDDILEDWYYTFILATTRMKIEEGLKQGIVGAFIYDAMAKIVRELRGRGVKGVFIPSVINLETVPISRKLNRIDMGTADKLSVAVLGIHEVSQEHGIPYEKVSYIHVEMGFGYNAVIAVKNGLIVDGIGGTLMPGPAFLTSGSLDLEVAQAVGSFDKMDVFSTGCNVFTKASSPEELLSRVGDDIIASTCFEAMMESVTKAVYSMLPIVENPVEILLSGRVARNPLVVEYLEDKLGRISIVRRMKGLPGARVTKETAQGYAVVADGIAGGVFRGLIEHVGVMNARGSALDYVVHPKFKHSRLGLKYLELRETLRGRPLNLEWWDRIGGT